MAGVVMSPELAQQVQRVVRQVLRAEHSTQQHQGRWQGEAVARWAIANEDIGAAGDGVRSARTGAIELLEVDTDGHLVRTGQTETLTHRWEGIEVLQNTLLRVCYQYGEWLLTGVDCEPLGSPPT
tara:strand:- start:52 stop:426 length:375 start_codon:yes stop_codon:yes gene_type:complete